MNSTTLRLRMESLTVLSNLRNTEVYKAYEDTMSALYTTPVDFCQKYAKLCRLHYENRDLGKLLAQEIHFDTNVLTKQLNKPLSAEIRKAIDFDLYTVNTLISLSGADFLEFAGKAYPKLSGTLNELPTFAAGSPLPFGNCEGLCQLYRKQGYGYFARANAYQIVDNQFQPIEHPDPIRLTDLKGYALEKKTIRDNTLALLAGRTSNNILLYGDKGCGKSSTVKAIANEYADRGLKIIEMPMSEIQAFPMICERITHSPFKFILFLDDLTFNSEDERFVALKAFIEGGVAGKPNNLVIYATSNRRHIIREKFSEREGDDIHRRDAMESAASLSDRFGIQITFSKPVKNEYLSIVEQLAEDYGLTLDEDKLHLLAERFATRRGGRSPRTARQFIMHQLALENGEAEDEKEEQA